MNAVPETLNVKGNVSESEWRTRVNLAAAYRLIAMFGWDDLVYTHISASVPDEEGHFLINPYGMMFEEITASSLVKINLDGEKVMPSAYPINPAGFTIHSAVHAVRHDVGCVMHTHTRAGIAVSAQKDGLLPISQHALLLLAEIGYHNYEGVALNADEKPRLVAALGDKALLILRNHGLLSAGPTIADAFQYMYFLEVSCQIQIAAQAGGELIMVDEKIQAGMAAQREQVAHGMGGDLVWPGLLRRLDRRNPGYDE
ncbi:MAG: class II aldolase/adducin family protein [Pseudomonadota bacterium]